MKEIIKAIKDQIFEVKVRIEVLECNIECCEEENEEKWNFEVEKNDLENRELKHLRQALVSMYSAIGVEANNSIPEGFRMYRK